MGREWRGFWVYAALVAVFALLSLVGCASGPNDWWRNEVSKRWDRSPWGGEWHARLMGVIKHDFDDARCDSLRGREYVIVLPQMNAQTPGYCIEGCRYIRHLVYLRQDIPNGTVELTAHADGKGCEESARKALGGT